MTTIAYCSGVLAGDTRTTDGDVIEQAHVRKVFKLNNGSLLGLAGTLANNQAALRELKKHPDTLEIFQSGEDEEDATEAIVIYPDGVVKILDSDGWIELEAPYHAIGSGRLVATVAMRMGATAIEAVKIAMEFDRNTGGKVQSVKLDKEVESKPDAVDSE